MYEYIIIIIDIRDYRPAYNDIFYVAAVTQRFQHWQTD